MSGIIVHDYPLSPFSQKLRLALGLKGLAYHAVTVPVWTPKPELMPLTGGYRRAPVMQVGADIYCDTQMILRELERRHPLPSLFPQGEALATALAWWVEKFTFVPAVGLVVAQMGEHFPPALLEERKPFFGFTLDKASMQTQQPVFLQQLHVHLGWLAGLLADGRAFLLGGQASAADLAAYHPIWFARQNGGPGIDALLPLAPLQAWYGRVGALGHGRPQPMSATDALAVAAGATPAEPIAAAEATDLPQCRLGDHVGVTADDTGRDTIAGVLVAKTADAIVLRRDDPQVGAINIHFPRAGFVVAAAASAH